MEPPPTPNPLSPTPGSAASDPSTQPFVPPLLSPLPAPVPPTTVPIGSTHSAISTINQNGRIADTSPLKALGWQPTDRLTIDTVDDVIVLARHHDGPCTLASQGHLYLSSALRHRHRIHPGDRILMVAALDRDQLVIYPPRTLHRILGEAHPDIWQDRP